MNSSFSKSIPNFTVIWLTTINNDTNSIAQLQSIINTSRIFTEINECINYLAEIQTYKAFMIIDYTLENELISFIDELPQVDSIHLYSTIDKATIQRWNDNDLSISSITLTDISSNDLNRLDQSFMYYQLIKEILLDIAYNVMAKTELAEYYRHLQSCGGTQNVSSVIDEFERD